MKLKIPPGKNLKFANHQRGIASLLITTLTGLALGAVAMGAMSQISGTQKSQEAMHAATQAEIKAWQGITAMGNYLQTTTATNTLSTCLGASNCSSLSMTSSDSPASVSTTATYNYVTQKQITVSSTGSSGGATATVNAVYALNTGIQQTAFPSQAWVFGGGATFNGNPTFTNISTVDCVNCSQITFNGTSTADPTKTTIPASSVPVANFDSLMGQANFVFYTDVNNTCSGGKATTTTANLCLIVKSVDYYSGGINTVLDGTYKLTCNNSGCIPTSTCVAGVCATNTTSTSPLYAQWIASTGICGTSGGCLTYSTSGGASTGGSWTMSAFNSPAVLWFEGDLTLASSTNITDSLIVTGNATLSGQGTGNLNSVTAPNSTAAAAETTPPCSATYWATDLCGTPHGTTLSPVNPIANSALLQGGTNKTDLDYATINGNILTNGYLYSNGTTTINGSAIVTSQNTTSTLNGTTITGNTGKSSGIVTGVTTALVFQWARYR